MLNTIRNFAVILSLTLCVTSLVKGDMECELLLENGDNNYLAHSKLGNVFAGFNQIFETVYNSESIKKSLDTKTLNFIELLLTAKKIELELKELDENKFNRTMEELCREQSSDNQSTDNLWLKCTHVILRTAIELRTLLTPIMTGYELEFSTRPRIG